MYLFYYTFRAHKVSFPAAVYGNRTQFNEKNIGTDTATVELFFNIFISGIETSVIPWEQLLYPCVVDVCRLGLETPCDTHLRLSVILKTDTDLKGIS